MFRFNNLVPIRSRISLVGRDSIFRFLAVATVLIAIVHFYSSYSDVIIPPSRWSWQSGSLNSNGCLVPNNTQIVITVKTGATEALEKIPTQLRTALRCAPHVYFFSDMNQTIGATKIHDALDTIPNDVKEGNTDFDIYRKQYELQDPDLINSTLRDFRDPRFPDSRASWTLDKYKNIHIVEKSKSIEEVFSVILLHLDYP